MPAVVEVIQTEQAPTREPGLAQVSEMRLTDAPFSAVRVTVAFVPSSAGLEIPPDVSRIVTVNV